MNCSNEPDMIADTFLNNVRNCAAINNTFCVAALIRSFFHILLLKVDTTQLYFIQESVKQ